MRTAYWSLTDAERDGLLENDPKAVAQLLAVYAEEKKSYRPSNRAARRAEARARRRKGASR